MLSKAVFKSLYSVSDRFVFIFPSSGAADKSELETEESKPTESDKSLEELSKSMESEISAEETEDIESNESDKA